ncbi:MAG: PadR family transcriptional regulator [Candidatus Bathyarchaeia archaeon]|nr:PadR family transcriptional regulator [Candidatus Bathyarchaeota archaeon]
MKLPLKRLIRKLTVENLWIYILSLLRDSPKYGYEIREEIRSRFGFKPGQVTSYMVLYTLEQDGYIESAGTMRSLTGPKRKYYRITEKGLNLLREAESFLSDIYGRLFK